MNDCLFHGQIDTNDKQIEFKSKKGHQSNKKIKVITFNISGTLIRLLKSF